MVRLSLLLFSALLSVSPASAQVKRAIMEGTAATSNTIFVDTNTVRVGVGTAAPAYRLDVQGDIRSTGSFIGSGALLTGLPIVSTAALQAQINAVAVSTGALYVATATLTTSIGSEAAARQSGDAALGVSTGSISNRVGVLEGNVSTTVFTTGSYSNPAWITSLAGSKVTGVTMTTDTVSGSRIPNFFASTDTISGARISSFRASTDTLSGDVSGSYTATVVASDSHDHTAATLSGVITSTAAIVSSIGAVSASVATAAFVNSSNTFTGENLFYNPNVVVQSATPALTLKNTASDIKARVSIGGTDPNDYGALSLAGIDDVTKSLITADPTNPSFIMGGLAVGGSSLSSGYKLGVSGNLGVSNHVVASSVTVSSTVCLGSDCRSVWPSGVITSTAALNNRIAVLEGATSTTVYTTNSYSNPSWITSLSTSKIDLSTVTSSHVLKVGDTMSGPLVVSSSVTANTYYGDGSNLTGLGAAGQLNYIFTSSASDIGSGYTQMVTASLYTQSPRSTITISGSLSSDVILATRATNVGYPGVTLIPTGRIVYHPHVWKGATGSAQIYCETYKRTHPGGVETLVATSNMSPALTTAETEMELDAIVTSPIMLSVTDRLVHKVLVRTLSTPVSVSIAVDGQGSNATWAGVSFPGNSVDAGSFVPYSGATAVVNLGSYGVNTSSYITAGRYQIGGADFVKKVDTRSIAIGIDAGKTSIADYGVWIGHTAGTNVSGIANVFMGTNVGGGSVSGGYNTAIGNYSGANLANGGQNTFFGSNSGQNVGAGFYNTCVGAYACDNVTSGSSNIVIGREVDPPSATGSYQLNIGNVIVGDMAASSVTVNNDLYAQRFHGDGSGLSGVITSTSALQSDVASRVLRAGDTMTGQLTISASSFTVASTSGQLTIGSANGDVHVKVRNLSTGLAARSLFTAYSSDINSFSSFGIADAGYGNQPTWTGRALFVTPSSVTISAYGAYSDIGFETGGSFNRRMTIRPNGYVGIGDSLPTAPLVVNGNIVSSGTVYAQNGFYGSAVGLTGVITSTSVIMSRIAAAEQTLSTAIYSNQTGGISAWRDNGLQGVLSVTNGQIGGTTAMGISAKSEGANDTNIGFRAFVSGATYANMSYYGTPATTVGAQNIAFYADTSDSSQYAFRSDGPAQSLFGGAVITSSFTQTPELCLGGDCKTDWPSSSGGVTTSTFTLSLHSGGDVFVSSGSFIPALGLAHVVEWSSVTVTGVKCYTLYTSTTNSTYFNIARSTDTGNFSGWAYMFSNRIEVSTNAKYSEWREPTSFSSETTPPVAWALHVTGVPSTGTLPQEYGCIIRYWRRLD